MTISSERRTTESTLIVASDQGLLLPDRAGPVLGGRRVGSIAVDGDTVWAVVDGVELHRIASTGSPELVGTLEGGTATCVHVHDGVVWLGGDAARLWRLADGALVPVERPVSARSPRAATVVGRGTSTPTGSTPPTALRLR